MGGETNKMNTIEEYILQTQGKYSIIIEYGNNQSTLLCASTPRTINRNHLFYGDIKKTPDGIIELKSIIAVKKAF